MNEFIEQDALISTPETNTPPPTPHTHEVSSFVATPRMDQGLLQKMLSWWKSELKPGMHVVRKDGDDLRYMFIITSNSYVDRDDETITSAALKAYEDSCYPGEDLYHNDNPLLWWHDDDVVMGHIVAVNYSEPLLIEIAKEAPTRVARILWDFAEQNGDNAGASHRFGYRDQDKSIEGDYAHIFKQESTYLPDRDLAANIRTYSGVIQPMASTQSDKRLDEIFEKAAGIPNASALLHAKSGELEKKLEALGINHKAAKPPLPPVEADAVDVAEDVAEEVVEEEVKAEMPTDMNLIMQIYNLLMDQVEVQMEGMNREAALIKSVKALEDIIEERQIAEKAHKQSLEDEIKALKQRVEIAEKRLDLRPRSVAEIKGHTPQEAIQAVVDTVEKAKIDGELEDVPGWGPLKPAPKTGK